MTEKPKLMEVISAGSLFTISTGQCSDYDVHGAFRAIKDIDAEALRSLWLETHPEQKENYEFNASEFLGWVTRLGFLEPLDSFE